MLSETEKAAARTATYFADCGWGERDAH